MKIIWSQYGSIYVANLSTILYTRILCIILSTCTLTLTTPNVELISSSVKCLSCSNGGITLQVRCFGHFHLTEFLFEETPYQRALHHQVPVSPATLMKLLFEHQLLDHHETCLQNLLNRMVNNEWQFLSSTLSCDGNKISLFA